MIRKTKTNTTNKNNKEEKKEQSANRISFSLKRRGMAGEPRSTGPNAADISYLNDNPKPKTKAAADTKDPNRTHEQSKTREKTRTKESEAKHR